MRRNRGEKSGCGVASCSRGLVFPQVDTTGPKSRGLVFPEGNIADPQMSNEATDGLAPSVLDSFSGAVRATSYEFPPASEEDPRREPRVRTRTLLPRPGAPARGHYKYRPKEPRTGVPRRGQCRPKNVQRSYRRVETVGFCKFSGAVRADYHVFPPTSKEDPRRETTGSDSRRAPEA